MSAFFFVLLYFLYVYLKKAIAKVRHGFKTIILALLHIIMYIFI